MVLLVKAFTEKLLSRTYGGRGREGSEKEERRNKDNGN